MSEQSITLQELVVELTDWCPLQCRHCSSQSGPSCGNRLTPEIIDSLLTEAKEIGIGQVSFGGGEPTASPILFDVLRKLDSMHIPAEVFTCGVAHDRDKITPFSHDLVGTLQELRRGLTLVFSFHGSYAQLHDDITQVAGSYDCLCKSLKRCIDAGVTCTANFVPLRINVSDFENVVKLVEDIGINKFSVLRFVPQGRGAENKFELQISRQEEDAFVHRLAVQRARSNMMIRTGSPFNGIIPDNNVLCRAGISKLVVQPDGNVLPCEVFKDDTRRDWGASVYNQTLMDILQSSKFVSLQRALKRAGCGDCPVHSRLNQKLSNNSRGVYHGISKATV